MIPTYLRILLVIDLLFRPSFRLVDSHLVITGSYLQSVPKSSPAIHICCFFVVAGASRLAVSEESRVTMIRLPAEQNGCPVELTAIGKIETGLAPGRRNPFLRKLPMLAFYGETYEIEKYFKLEKKKEYAISPFLPCYSDSMGPYNIEFTARSEATR